MNMRRRLLLLSLLLIGPFASAGMLYITGDGARVRKSASYGNNIASHLNTGDAVEVLGTDGVWIHIKRSDGTTGWVHRKLLSQNNPHGDFQPQREASIVPAGAASGSREMVIIGDSITCGPFGQRLLKDQAALGYHVVMYCAERSSPVHWLEGRKPKYEVCKTDKVTKKKYDCVTKYSKCQTMDSDSLALRVCPGDGKLPKLSDPGVLAQIVPPGARVVVALGTNVIPVCTNSCPMESTATLANLFSGHTCEWVGPHNFSDSALQAHIDQYYSGLESSQSTCKMVDSRPVTPALQLHPDVAPAQDWADKISARMMKPALSESGRLLSGALSGDGSN